MLTEFPETRDTLLVRVRSPENQEAWDQFVLIYRPVIYRLARYRGLQDADQGQRQLSHWSCEGLEEEIIVPTAAAAFHDQTLFAGVLFEER